MKNLIFLFSLFFCCMFPLKKSLAINTSGFPDCKPYDASKKSDKDIEAIDSSISRDDKENDEVVHSLWEKDKPSLSTHQERELLEHGYNSEDEFFLLAEQKGTLTGLETVPSSEDRYWASSGIEGKVKLLLQYFNLILSFQIISFSYFFIFP